jgi:hypothetical protein
MDYQYTHDKDGLAWAWPVYDEAEVKKLNKPEVLATWYVLWGNAHCVKAPDYFGNFCVALVERARVLSFDLYAETDFFKNPSPGGNEVSKDYAKATFWCAVILALAAFWTCILYRLGVF